MSLIVDVIAEFPKIQAEHMISLRKRKAQLSIGEQKCASIT